MYQTVKRCNYLLCMTTHAQNSSYMSYTIFKKDYWLIGGQRAVSYMLTPTDPAVRQPLC